MTVTPEISVKLERRTDLLNELLGNYRIVRLLGEGGMGAVYEAVHNQLERRVAIKVLHPEFSKDQLILSRFFNEARAVSIVGHPSLVDVYEFVTREDGCAYLVMQLLEGDSLKKRSAESGGKLGHSALLIARQIATALAATHAKGIVHRRTTAPIEKWGLGFPWRGFSVGSFREIDSAWRTFSSLHGAGVVA